MARADPFFLKLIIMFDRSKSFEKIKSNIITR